MNYPPPAQFQARNQTSLPNDYPNRDQYIDYGSWPVHVKMSMINSLLMIVVGFIIVIFGFVTFSVEYPFGVLCYIFFFVGFLLLPFGLLVFFTLICNRHKAGCHMIVLFVGNTVVLFSFLIIFSSLCCGKGIDDYAYFSYCLWPETVIVREEDNETSSDDDPSLSSLALTKPQQEAEEEMTFFDAFITYAAGFVTLREEHKTSIDKTVAYYLLLQQQEHQQHLELYDLNSIAKKEMKDKERNADDDETSGDENEEEEEYENEEEDEENEEEENVVELDMTYDHPQVYLPFTIIAFLMIFPMMIMSIYSCCSWAPSSHCCRLLMLYSTMFWSFSTMLVYGIMSLLLRTVTHPPLELFPDFTRYAVLWLVFAGGFLLLMILSCISSYGKEISELLEDRALPYPIRLTRRELDWQRELEAEWDAQAQFQQQTSGSGPAPPLSDFPPQRSGPVQLYPPVEYPPPPGWGQGTGPVAGATVAENDKKKQADVAARMGLRVDPIRHFDKESYAAPKTEDCLICSYVCTDSTFCTCCPCIANFLNVLMMLGLVAVVIYFFIEVAYQAHAYYYVMQYKSVFDFVTSPSPSSVTPTPVLASDYTPTHELLPPSSDTSPPHTLALTLTDYLLASPATPNVSASTPTPTHTATSTFSASPTSLPPSSSFLHTPTPTPPHMHMHTHTHTHTEMHTRTHPYTPRLRNIEDEDGDGEPDYPVCGYTPKMHGKIYKSYIGILAFNAGPVGFVIFVIVVVLIVIALLLALLVIGLAGGGSGGGGIKCDGCGGGCGNCNCGGCSNVGNCSSLDCGNCDCARGGCGGCDGCCFGCMQCFGCLNGGFYHRNPYSYGSCYYFWTCDCDCYCGDACADICCCCGRNWEEEERRERQRARENARAGLEQRHEQGQGQGQGWHTQG